MFILPAPLRMAEYDKRGSMGDDTAVFVPNDIESS